MTNKAAYPMKTFITALLLICLLSCNDDEPKDPFVGTWEYRPIGRLPLSTVHFQISAGYQINSVFVDNETWTRGETRDAIKGQEIGMIIISEDIASSTGMAFYGCTVSNGKVIRGDTVYTDKPALLVDSVWHLSGIPQTKVILYNQVIVRE